jgi:hypothetical protein
VEVVRGGECGSCGLDEDAAVRIDYGHLCSGRRGAAEAVDAHMNFVALEGDILAVEPEVRALPVGRAGLLQTERED